MPLQTVIPVRRSSSRQITTLIDVPSMLLFRARSLRYYIEAGGYVQVGKPVAHLVMMDPIKVDISVSAQNSREPETA